MKFKWNAASRFLLLFTILWCLVCFAVGCTTSWVSEATSIIQLLVPAITSALSILTAFGAGITPTALETVQKWASQATAALEEVGNLITQYETAEADAKPGILTEVQVALSTIVGNLSTVLPMIRVENQQTQDRILAVIGAVQVELQALINLVPAVKGEVTSSDELKTLMKALKTPKEFRAEFNNLVAPFGKPYEI